MTSSWRAVAALHYLIPLVLGQYTPLPRWGQAVALLENVLYVHGGLTDQYDQYSYTSAPPTSELLFLDLSVSFSATSPPWQLLSNTTTTSSSPALGWHSLSAFNTSSLLLFGGQPGPNSQTVLTTLNDSAALVSAYNRTDPSFLMEPQNWAGQPARRIRHSASSNSGNILVVGGEKADGSGNSFSDHYIFNPASQKFAMIPLGGDPPPDIFGHASLVLPDGRLLVLGGYCASCGDLVPLNTIWSLDTTQATLVWDMISVSNSTLPSPRRDFAAVVLATGEILIHGGGDSALEVTYSDGWILNTTQNPMVWREAQSLQQLGARKDHLAVQSNGQVLFAFGYGASAPASATMQIYDSSSSSIVSSYSPSPAGSTPISNSLPVPSQTGNLGSGGSAGATGVYPTSTASADSSPSKDNIIAIALGTTFGIIGLVAGGLAAAWYIKRSRERETSSHGRFFLLGGDLENESTDGGVPNALSMRDLNEREYQRNHGFAGAGAFPLAAVLTHLGLSKHSPPEPSHPRRDMFADEDTRQFGWGGSLPGMSRREGSTGTSAWSLPSMSAIVRGMISREPSASNSDQEWGRWEKTEADRKGLIHEDSSFNAISNNGRLHGRGDGSWSYTDPFLDSDPMPNVREYDLYQPHPGALESEDEYDNFELGNASRDPTPLRPQMTPLSLSSHIHILSPLREVPHTAPSDALTSCPRSSQDNSFPTGPPSSHANRSQTSSPSQPPHSPVTSHISYTSAPTSALPQRPSILNSHLPTSHPIRRSDSWWGRFMKTPLLDRCNSTGQKPLDFRDPNSAPRLMPVEESKASSDSPESNGDFTIKHGRLIPSSIHSGRTANTEVAERLGGSYDVVQRIASDGSTSRRTASIGSMSANELGLLESLEQVKVTSPSPMSPMSNPPHPPEEDLPSSMTGSPSTPGSRPIRASGHAVSSRIQEIERQIINSLETERSPPPRNTRKREEVPSRTRPTIQYGLAPRPSLYVTNPDSNVPTS